MMTDHSHHLPEMVEQIAALIDPPAWTGLGRRTPPNKRGDESRRKHSLKKAGQIVEVLGTTGSAPSVDATSILAAQRASIIAMIHSEAAKRRGRGIKRLADILTGAIAARFDEEDEQQGVDHA